jgi:murein DD-endopeptidase MepM/ murein hydrolase activator NlpD
MNKAIFIRLSGCYTVLIFFKTVTGFWFVSAFVAVLPSAAHAIKAERSRNDVSKNTPTLAGARLGKLTKPPVLVGARQTLLKQTIPAPVDDLTDKRDHVIQRMRAGDTLVAIVNRFNLPAAEKWLWARSIKRDLGVQQLPVGREVHFYFAKVTTRFNGQPAPGQLKAIEVDYNDSSSLTWEKGIVEINFHKNEKPFDVELKTVSTVVEDSLFEDGRKAGIHPKLLTQVAEIFTFDVDVEKEIQKGDRFKILYETRRRLSQDANASPRILAAELLSAGRKFTAIYVESAKGRGSYYNLEGRSLARSFIRFPLDFISITSPFAVSRFNPILKVNMPHTGVDFAAPRGTPIHAVGDGIVSDAGWNGAYGKMIDIKHGTNYLSRYAHLDSFAEGVRPGSVVTKGQIIGYLGSTGRSTGPHLHYELHKDQLPIDPLNADFPFDDTIEPILQTAFNGRKQIYLTALASVPDS